MPIHEEYHYPGAFGAAIPFETNVLTGVAPTPILRATIALPPFTEITKGSAVVYYWTSDTGREVYNWTITDILKAVGGPDGVKVEFLAVPR